MQQAGNPTTDNIAEKWPVNCRVPRALILAAGRGDRLRAYEGFRAKPLVLVSGVSLAERCLRTLSAAGVVEVVFVLGHRAWEVRQHVEIVKSRYACSVRFVMAEHWQQGNGTSTLAGAAEIGNVPFLLTMVDHVASPRLIRRLLLSPPGPGEAALAVDLSRESLFDETDLTKVRVSGGKVSAIGKDLDIWDGGDTGFFYATGSLFSELDEARKEWDCSLTGGMRRLSASGRLLAVPVSGESWIDVDTPVAVRAAERLVADE